MKTLAKGIVKTRYILMALFAVVAVGCIFLIPRVNTNYDIIKYLPPETETVIALNEMEKQFGAVGTAQVMVKVDASEVSGLKAKLEAIEGMQAVVAGTDAETYREGYALFKLFLTDSSFSLEAQKIVNSVRTTLDGYDIAMNGSAVSSTFLKEAIVDDMVLILVIACIIIAVILLITSSSWVDPLIFGAVVGVSLLINLGTNALLPEVSFITKAICAIMQLALAMDYSIILLHRFNEERKCSLSDKDAMVAAISGSFTSVAASSLTTIAGLVALMFMKFTIGLDVGIVLSKGIIVSLISVFFFMPGVILLLAPAIKKTNHKTLQQKTGEISANSLAKRQMKLDAQAAKTGATPKRAMTYIDFAFKSRKIVPLIVIVILVAGAIMSFSMTYSYELETSKNPQDSVNAEDTAIENIFGKQNSLVVLVNSGNLDREQEVVDYMLNYEYKGKKVINGAQGMAALGFGKKIPVATLKGILSAADVNELLQKCGVPLNAETIRLYDIVKLLSKAELTGGLLPNTEMTYIATLVRRALGVGVGVIELIGKDLENPNSYTAEALASNLTEKIKPLTPGLTVTAETIGKLYTACGFDPTASVTISNLLKEISDKKLAAGLFGEGNTIGNLLQTIIDKAVPLLPKLHVQMTIAEFGALLPMEGITDNLGLLFNSYHMTNASVFQLLQMFAGIVPEGGSGGSTLYSTVACAKIVSLILPTVELAFTMFESKGGMSRLMFNLNMPIATDESFEAMAEITAGLKEIYGDETMHIACETGAYSSIKDIFTVDSTNISLISFFAIFLIVLLAFRSVGVPAILTLLIQGATWVGMSMQFMGGSVVFFVCYLVVTCIQMGATVDYAILITNRYVENRYSMKRIDAMKKAFGTSIMTIMTSGSILVIAAFLVGMVSKVAIIADLGVMLSIGCLVSLLIIVFALPQILLVCDKLIEKTTWKKKGKHFIKDNEVVENVSNDGGTEETVVADTGAGETSITGLVETGTEAAADNLTLCGLEETKK